jgi:hypothetical protein
MEDPARLLLKSACRADKQPARAIRGSDAAKPTLTTDGLGSDLRHGTGTEPGIRGVEIVFPLHRGDNEDQ